jgi:GNAT superfamily N-acetyltransferase
VEIRQVSGLEDQRICADIFVRSIDSLHERNGQPPTDTSDMGWLPASLAYFAEADPEGLVLALEDGAPVAFGCAMRRERFWFLSYLFVLPDAQAKGVGRALLEHLLPPEAERSSMDLATVVESRQPVSTMLYSRYGIVPRTPLYWMTHLPGIEGLPRLAAGVRARPIELETDGEAIDAFDRALLGYARPQDHRMWVRTSKTARVYLGDDGSLAGYGYHGADDWLTPLAARDEALVAGMIRDLLEAHTGPTEDLVVQISGGSAVLLPQLLAAGMRSDEGAQMIYCSTGRVPGPGYLLYAGYHP